MFAFFFNDTATTEIYTLSLHDALPISAAAAARDLPRLPSARGRLPLGGRRARSEEHTSELQSRLHLVCRLLLEKKISTELQPAEKNKNRIEAATPVRNRNLTLYQPRHV